MTTALSEQHFAHLKELLGSEDHALARQGGDLVLSLVGDAARAGFGRRIKAMLRKRAPRRVGLGLVVGLAEAGCPLALTRLDLRYEEIGAAGVRALIEAGCLRGLAALDLRYDELGDEGAILLAGCADLAGLRSLSLQGNGIGPEGAKALAESPHLAGLAALDLRYNTIGEEGARALAQSPHLRGLSRLDLYYEDVGYSGGALALAGAEGLPAGARRYWRGLATGGWNDEALGSSECFDYDEDDEDDDGSPAETPAAGLQAAEGAPPPTVQVEGLALSPAPAGRFTAVRYVDEERIPPALRPLFARPSAEMPGIVAAFVDPEEMHFRTFENILPLDRLFEPLAQAQPPLLRFDLADRRPLAPGQPRRGDAWLFTLDAPERALALLRRLDELDLYAPPLNAGSRGGLRLVFHSALLSEALSAAVRAALPADALRGFSHVNPVIRCNRFEPGSEPFHSHYDTPYYDASRHHISRYTLLIYLTGGEGSPALRIEDDALDAIAPLTCVVFDQRREHAGAAYAQGRKVFLRTELIFEDASVGHDARLAALFARACYLTGESQLLPELSAAAHDCYDRVAAAHWEGWKPPRTRLRPFVSKQFRGVPFVTNGYDFWFRERDLDPRGCAALALLDYFNCKVGRRAFRKLCQSRAVHGKRGSSWIPAFLGELPDPPEPLFGALDKGALFHPPEAPDPDICCDFHGGSSRFHGDRCEDVISEYRREQARARAHILPAPVLMLGQEIFLDPARFVVQGGQIHVLSREALAPVNFAACWNMGSPPDYVLDEAELQALVPLVPPLLFARKDGCYHLMLDFFRNSWVDARCAAEPAGAPRIGRREEWDDEYEDEDYDEDEHDEGDEDEDDEDDG